MVCSQKVQESVKEIPILYFMPENSRIIFYFFRQAIRWPVSLFALQEQKDLLATLLLKDT